MPMQRELCLLYTSLVSAVQFKELGEVLQETNHEVPLLILTDGVEDPHNLSLIHIWKAILRVLVC